MDRTCALLLSLAFACLPVAARAQPKIPTPTLQKVLAEDLIGKARIRAQVSAAHSQADLDFALDAFAAVKRELGI